MFNELLDDEIVESWEIDNLTTMLITYLIFFIISIYLLYTASLYFFAFILIYLYYKNKKNRNINFLHNYIVRSELTFLKRFYV